MLFDIIWRAAPVFHPRLPLCQLHVPMYDRHWQYFNSWSLVSSCEQVSKSSHYHAIILIHSWLNTVPRNFPEMLWNFCVRNPLERFPNAVPQLHQPLSSNGTPLEPSDIEYMVAVFQSLAPGSTKNEAVACLTYHCWDLQMAIKEHTQGSIRAHVSHESTELWSVAASAPGTLVNPAEPLAAGSEETFVPLFGDTKNSRKGYWIDDQLQEAGRQFRFVHQTDQGSIVLSHAHGKFTA